MLQEEIHIWTSNLEANKQGDSKIQVSSKDCCNILTNALCAPPGRHAAAVNTLSQQLLTFTLQLLA